MAIKHVEKDRISDWGELVSAQEGAIPRVDGVEGYPPTPALMQPSRPRSPMAPECPWKWSC